MRVGGPIVQRSKKLCLVGSTIVYIDESIDVYIDVYTDISMDISMDLSMDLSVDV